MSRDDWTSEDWQNYNRLKTQKKEEKKQKAHEKLVKEISREIRLYPNKYPYTGFYTSWRAAEINNFSVWWGKCKHGHLTERHVTEKICPVCNKMNKDRRDKRIKDGYVSLSKNEQVRLYEIYAEAKRTTEQTGVQHHVDHIRPLAAGGTHHPDNLQILKASENLSKGAYYKGKRKTYSKAEKKAANKEFVKKKREEDAIKLTELRQKAEAEHKKLNSWNPGGIFFLILVVILVAAFVY